MPDVLTRLSFLATITESRNTPQPIVRCLVVVLVNSTSSPLAGEAVRAGDISIVALLSSSSKLTLAPTVYGV